MYMKLLLASCLLCTWCVNGANTAESENSSLLRLNAKLKKSLQALQGTENALALHANAEDDFEVAVAGISCDDGSCPWYCVGCQCCGGTCWFLGSGDNCGSKGLSCQLFTKVAMYVAKKVSGSGCGFLARSWCTIEAGAGGAAACEVIGVGPEDPAADACAVAVVTAVSWACKYACGKSVAEAAKLIMNHIAPSCGSDSSFELDGDDHSSLMLQADTSKQVSCVGQVSALQAKPACKVIPVDSCVSTYESYSLTPYQDMTCQEALEEHAGGKSESVPMLGDSDCSSTCRSEGHGNGGYVIGTAPFCNADCNDCNEGNYCYKNWSEDAGCWFGNKACCCDAP